MRLKKLRHFECISALTTVFIKMAFSAFYYTFGITIADNANNSTACSFDVQVNNAVGIESLQQNSISIYPNPTRGMINLKIVNNDIKNIFVFDISGKKIIEILNINQNQMIDLSSYENAVYIIKILTGNEMFISKIVKE